MTKPLNNSTPMFSSSSFRMIASLLAGLGLAWCTTASAELYKCKDTNGKTTYQETPCANEQTQKKLRRESESTDPAASAGGRVVSGKAIVGANGETRVPIARSPSQAEMDACVNTHRGDLEHISDSFIFSGRVFKRMWLLDNGTQAERMILVVTLEEKNKLRNGDRKSFTCALRGDNSIDSSATKEFVER